MVSNAHEELLRLLGWDGPELEAFLPEWLRAAAFLKLSERDAAYAAREWLPRYWDLSLLGVRKLIAACLREVTELSKMKDYKAAGQKILYSNTTASHVSIYANRLAGEGRLHVAYPSFITSTVYQGFFGKEPSQMYGASHFNPLCQHCALNVGHASSVMAGMVPPPSVTWTWGLHCSEAPKTDEFLDCMREEPWPAVLTSIPHDAPLGMAEAEDESRTACLAEVIRDGQSQVSALTGIPVTDAHIREALTQWLSYLRRVDRLTGMVAGGDPQPMSGSELTMFGLCMQVCFDTGLTYLNDALDTAIAEVSQRLRKGEGVLPKGAPKVACHFQPPNMPWVDRAFQANGVNLSLGRLFPSAAQLEKAVDPEDLYRTVARHCLMCPDAVNMRDEMRIVSGILSQYSFDGALSGFFSNDRWIGAPEKMMGREVEERTGIPHYYLTGDFWDDSYYSLEDRLPVIRSICSSLKIARI